MNNLYPFSNSYLQINDKIIITPNHLPDTISIGDISSIANLPAIALKPQKSEENVNNKCGLFKKLVILSSRLKIKLNVA